MRPGDLIDPIKDRINPKTVARYLYDHCRGHERRIKCEDLSRELSGHAGRGGNNAADVAMRETLTFLVKSKLPIGSLNGPTGGFWWIDSEKDRQRVVRQLRALARSTNRKADHLESITSFEYRDPPGQEELFT